MKLTLVDVKWLALVGLIAGLTVFSGCETLSTWVGENEGSLRVTEALLTSPLATNLTAGLSGLAAALLSSFIALNRHLVAKKRAKALKEIDANPKSLNLKDLVTTEASRKVVSNL